VPAADVPGIGELFDRADELEMHLCGCGDQYYSLIAVGDIMLAGRATKSITQQGADYPFAATLPLLRRASTVVGNLEGPFAQRAALQHRNHAYRVHPSLGHAMRRAGIDVVSLANNHLTDCGRAGVRETLGALAGAGITPIGGGLNEAAAHTPAVREAFGMRIGLLAYYWNRRTAATTRAPGSAMDLPAALESDISGLKKRVDRVVAIFHWGIPYQVDPLPEDRVKAQFAIDCGADAVIGHHPHIVQPFAIYHGRPIFFSIGNFAFGSGNSLAEGLILALRFEESRTMVDAFPIYVKNRDARVNYQPKMLKAQAAEHRLDRLAQISGAHGSRLRRYRGWGRLELPC
jgi:poly-gamma-glutamate capsule biosynthesis protein CapA/YwtB (metallophosphatase superfamily)